MAHLSSAGGDDAPDGPRLPHRLDSWKEIASHFRRDMRTVRRWEQAEGMPVHRHLHRARGSVYAYADELDRWWDTRRSQEGPGEPPGGRARAWLTALVAGSLSIAALAFVVHRAAVVPGHLATADSRAGREVSPPPSRQLPDDPQAREAFLVARQQLSRRTGFRHEARRHLELVVARAPAFAEAHALLGEAYLRQGLYDAPTRAQAWEKAEASARRAVALHDDLAVAHRVLGRVLLLRHWNWTSAEAEIVRAIELDPGDLEARSTRALYLRSAGRLDEALAERQRVQQADPLHAYWLVALGNEYAFARRYAEAGRSFERALELERDYQPAIAGLAGVLARAGRLGEAAAWTRQHLRLTGRDDLAAGYDDVLRREGPASAERWLDRQHLLEFSRDADHNLWSLACTHARLGDREEALRFLELAYQQRDVGLLQARVDPDMDPLRDDSRFDDLLRRVGPPE
jgi:tetratricopeptide (TPR) repeat protein